MKIKLVKYLFFAFLPFAIFESCQKPNSAADNNAVIETPYTLYFGDSTGVLYNTNDGMLIKKLPFSADGTPYRAICTSLTTLMFNKNATHGTTGSLTNIYFSSNSGLEFNLCYDSVNTLPRVALNGVTVDLDQSQILDIRKWNRVYCATANTASPVGLAYSTLNGIWGSFVMETEINTSQFGAVPASITGITFTTNGTLFGLDGAAHRSFFRTDVLTTTQFTETTPGGSWNPSGAALPNSGFFNVGHYNNEVIAIDNTGLNGAWYSDDLGMNWYQFSGIPANVPLMCTGSPFEEVNFVGTYGYGLYILNANTHVYQPCNSGLGSNLIVRGIAAKENIYKNGNVEKFVYVATSKGVYKSRDLGQNWTLIKTGNFTAIY